MHTEVTVLSSLLESLQRAKLLVMRDERERGVAVGAGRKNAPSRGNLGRTRDDSITRLLVALAAKPLSCCTASSAELPSCAGLEFDFLSI
jgi:hypothetical protein